MAGQTFVYIEILENEQFEQLALIAVSSYYCAQFSCKTCASVVEAVRLGIHTVSYIFTLSVSRCGKICGKGVRSIRWECPASFFITAGTIRPFPSFSLKSAHVGTSLCLTVHPPLRGNKRVFTKRGSQRFSQPLFKQIWEQFQLFSAAQVRDSLG